MNAPGTATATVRVALGARAYDIIVGRGSRERAAEFIRPLLARARAFVLTDENVAATQWQRLETSLKSAGIECLLTVVPAGEGSKDLDQLGRVLEAMIERRVERSDVLLALG